MQHRTVCALFVLASALLGSGLAYRIAQASPEPVRLGTTEVERVIVLPDLRVTAEPLTDAQWEDLNDSGRTPAPCVQDCPAPAPKVAPKAARKPATKPAKAPACRVHVLEQGGRPGARTVLACG